MANPHVLLLLQEAQLKRGRRWSDFLRDALQTDLQGLATAALGGACLGALPWLLLELAGINGEAIHVAGAISASAGSMILLGRRLSQALTQAGVEYRTYGDYRRSRDGGR